MAIPSVAMSGCVGCKYHGWLVMGWLADKIQKKYVMIITYALVALSMGLEMMNSAIES